ncbi:flagellar protein FliT [Kushneria indalinina]|uniref:Flagellar protein FliT n=1 Tax=Kushneria indalinina DSM 14324 TaxID=1122140 RepID=A0A3D9E002_9GAMM|nr:flagellar protein FliT [Kushneria indalinina]REC96366.1 flagellar protein FliT [Kushneria indalinina DSM 14324]
MEKKRALIIHGYERALELSQKMLGYADAGEWQQLIALEHDYLCEIDRLRIRDGQITLDSTRQTYKKEILARLLENDQRLHTLLQQRLAELSHLMGQGRVQQQVSRAYSAASAPLGE